MSEHECTCGVRNYDGPGKRWLSHAPGCATPYTPPLEFAHPVIEAELETHRPAGDWHCACGADLFGGTAAYSWSLFKSHAAERIIAALAAQPSPASPDTEGGAE